MSDSSSGFVFEFLAAFDELLGEVDYGARKGSPAELEAIGYQRPESVRTAYGLGSMALSSARDHLEAVDLIVRLGQPSVAHVTCLRGLLEGASIASWLFDPTVGTQERVGRSLALRFNTLKGQRKLVLAKGDTTGVREIDERILETERLAEQLGFPRIRNSKGQRDGIGQRKPTVTDLIESQYGSESIYTVLSGVAHSDFAFTMSLGFTQASGLNSNDQPYARRKVNLEVLNLLLKASLNYYVRPLWMQVIQFGADRSRAAGILENQYDQLAISHDASVRHWRRDLGG